LISRNQWGDFGFWNADFGLKMRIAALAFNPKSKIRNLKWLHTLALLI
jgi:hypothetical protein